MGKVFQAGGIARSRGIRGRQRLAGDERAVRGVSPVCQRDFSCEIACA